MQASSPNSDWLQPLRGTPMGDMVARFDWSSSLLGHPDGWPHELKAAVRLCLTTRFPFLVMAGREMVMIYNDGYREMLGDEKHPGALGRPAQESWSEIWDVIEPQFESIFETALPTWSDNLHLVIERNGYPEETYFAYSYSPLLDAGGEVTGIIDISTETTSAVITDRRLRCLNDLHASLMGVSDLVEVCRRAALALSRWTTSVRAADIYLVVGGQEVLAASNRRRATRRVDPIPIDQAPVGDRPVAKISIPIGGTPDEAAGTLVLSLNTNRPFDSGYAEFISFIGRTIGDAIETSRRHAMEIDEYRHIGDTLQEAMLRPASNFRTVAARYLPAVGNLAVGGDWYDVIDLPDERRALVVGDCVGHGLNAAAAMAQLRSATRAMLLTGADAAETLAAQNSYAGTVDGAMCATMAIVIVDRAAQTISYARAGHPPPLVVRPGGVTALDGSAGPPLAAVDAPAYQTEIEPFKDGDLVVLYSDGLIERRGESLDVGLERLGAAVEKLYGQPLETLADDLISEMLLPSATDDVVLVVKQLDLSTSDECEEQAPRDEQPTAR